MSQAFFRFYEELNDFLPSSRKKQQFTHSFEGNQSVKDMIESFGVPHVEVDLVLVNGRSVNFKYRVKDGDQISVYPVFESIDISSVQHLRPEPLRDVRFIADVHLKKLAKYLRLAGFDTTWEDSYTDNQIIHNALKEKRIILTRDRILLRNSLVTHGTWIRSDAPSSQLREVISRFDLKRRLKPFTICMECNSSISAVPMETVIDRLPDRTREYYTEFRMCSGCGKVYWEGSHFGRMKQMLEELAGESD